MRPRALKQSCLAVTQIIAIAVCLSAPSAAQTPTPSPSPAAPTTNTGGTAFAENLEKLARRAADLAPVIQKELEGPLLPWLEKLSLTLAGLIMIAAFAKMWRENAGAGVDLFWWFARLGVIFALLGSGPKIINGMAETGQEIAGSRNKQTTLYQFYERQRNSFDDNYKRFTNGTFTVNKDPVNPVPGGVVGVLSSDESSAQGPVSTLDRISRSMPLLLDVMNISRGVMSFGDLFLTLLSGFLMIAMRLAAPVMIALAIDRGIAQQVTYPYLWGVVVLTLIWPVVALIIQSAAYLGGNIGLALGDGQQFYQFDSNTMGIIRNGSQPVYTVFFAAAIMLIAGLSLWMSPYIAYQLSVGKLYEVASTATSFVGSGIQYYGASLAASTLRQAVIPQAAGQVGRPGPVKESEGPTARANNILGFTGASGVPPSRLAGIKARPVGQVPGNVRF